MTLDDQLDSRRGAVMLGIWKAQCGLGTPDSVRAWRAAALGLRMWVRSGPPKTNLSVFDSVFTLATRQLIDWYIRETAHLGYVPSPEVTAFVS